VIDQLNRGDAEPLIGFLNENPEALNHFIFNFAVDETESNEKGFAPLHFACARGHEGLVDFLLARLALVNLNADTSRRPMPLHLATQATDESAALRIVEKLVKNGAELNGVDAGRQTALHLAAKRGSMSLVRLLIRLGSDPLLKDQSGLLPRDLNTDPALASELSLRRIRDLFGGEDDLP
jgi:ankyrin repeat protein